MTSERSTMPEQSRQHEFAHLNAAANEIWDSNADFWDQRMGEGNLFHNTLVRPTQERLLAIQPGERVLDVACGNGNFARQMADLGALVVGVDASPRMIQHAVARSADYGDRVQFHVMDATDQAAVAELGDASFDAIACTMAIMDMARVEPLAAAVARLLKPKGRFVFSLMHPAFNSSAGLTRVAERVEREDGTITDQYSVNIFRYIQPHSHMGVAMIGQPRAQHYFHRPIGVLLTAFFEAGFVADGIEEPTFDEQSADHSLDLVNFKDMPPVLAVRLRQLG